MFASLLSGLLVRAARHRGLERVATQTPAVRRIALRFVAGERLDDGIDAARELAAGGRRVSLDVVGEHVDHESAARAAAGRYRATLDAVAAADLPAGISVKPSQLGATFAPGLAEELLDDLATRAGRIGAHLTLDMEDHTTTDTTLDLVEHLVGAGHDHVGCAVQAYLHRTPRDLDRLCELGASVRLCKGAYAEPVDVAHQRRAAIDTAYRRCATHLLERGTYPRFATHDHRLVGAVRCDARRLGLPRDAYEFQVLHGVRPDLQRRLVEVGERVCVYVPFGDAWYAYFVRRLAERPANLLFFLRALRG